MSAPAIVAIFGPVPAGVDLGNRIPHSVEKIGVLVPLGFAAIALMLRITARSLSKAGIKADDWLMVVALLMTSGTAGMTFIGSAYGSGTHVWSLTIPKVVMLFKILYAYTFVYAASVSFTKFSILFFYHRIFQSNAGRMYQVCFALGAFLACSYPIITWTTMACACVPKEYFWERINGMEGTCISGNQFILIIGIVKMVNDIILLMIPIPQIWRLNMSRKKRLGVIGTLLMGSIVCAASIVRIYHLSAFVATKDVTYVMSGVFIWSSVEPAVGIFSACLPTLPPLIRFIRNKKHKGSLEAGCPTGKHSQYHLATGGMNASRNRRASRATRSSQLPDRPDDRTFMHMNDDECELTSYIRSGYTQQHDHDHDHDHVVEEDDGAHVDEQDHSNKITVRSSIDQSTMHRSSPVSFSSAEP